MGFDAFGEILPVFLFFGAPGDFRKGAGAWVYHVFYPLTVLHIFGPDIGLGTQNVFGFFSAQFRWNRFVAVRFFQGNHSADGQGFGRWVALVVVIIAEVCRRHNGIVAGFGCSDTTFDTPPTHHCGRWRESAFQNFVPADQFFAAFGEHGFRPADEITL